MIPEPEPEPGGLLARRMSNHWGDRRPVVGFRPVGARRAKLADGDYATPLTKDYVLSKYDDMTKEVLAKYGKQVWADFLPPAVVVPGYLWQLSPPEEVNLQAKKIEEAWKKYLPKLVMAKDAAAFDAMWEEMKSTMDKAGLADVNAAYTQLWADFNAKFKETIGE